MPSMKLRWAMAKTTKIGKQVNTVAAITKFQRVMPKPLENGASPRGSVRLGASSIMMSGHRKLFQLAMACNEVAHPLEAGYVRVARRIVTD